MYLYKHQTQPEKKLAIKVENASKLGKYGSVMTKESYYLRMMNDKKCDRVIGYYGDGDGFWQGVQYMKIEYLDMTLEAYLEKPNIPNKISVS